MARLTRIILLAVPALVFIGVFMYDVVTATYQFQAEGPRYVRDILVVGSFFLLYLVVRSRWKERVRNVPKEMGRLLMMGVSVIVLSSVVSLSAGITSSGSDTTPVSRAAILGMLSMVAAIPLAVFAMRTVLSIQGLLFQRRKKGTRRNLIIFVVLLFGSAVLTYPALSVQLPFASSALLSLAIVMILVNSFKQSWIVSLSRREKLYAIVYSALLFLAFLFLSVLVENQFPQRALATLTPPLQRFTFLAFVFGAVYFGMAFVSALFHLPTAEEYERKQSELSSLHNLSRLVAQVFDFRDLVNTVTQMTLEVCGATSAWLELIRRDPSGTARIVEIVSRKNISEEQIEAVTTHGGTSLRDIVFESQKYLLIDDVRRDRRTSHIRGLQVNVASLVSVPLIAQGRIIGILHATKDMEFGFDRDDVEVLTTFADNVAIAIENARLIVESLERERLKQEMMVAQGMQKRLIPVSLPTVPSLDLAATWEPSMEVGGDYYDFVRLDGGKLGLVVADVSGKGVSAAFYMAEVKGIFQSLSKVCSSPKDLLVRANDTLMGSLEKRAFISLLYAIVDLRQGTIVLARAGHCPIVYISGDRGALLRPDGVGLGLTDGELFEQSTQELTLQLQPGDVCLFYTDGVTESRNGSGHEYGYQRLVDTALKHRTADASTIRDFIVQDLRLHTGAQSFSDDMTLVVAKWNGSPSENQA